LAVLLSARGRKSRPDGVGVAVESLPRFIGDGRLVSESETELGLSFLFLFLFGLGLSVAFPFADGVLSLLPVVRDDLVVLRVFVDAGVAVS